MQLEAVIALCRSFESEGLRFWIDGGWGVDALLAMQTRPHSDLDLAVHFGDMPLFAQLLESLSYQRAVGPELPDWNWVFCHQSEGMVDLHGFVLNDDGDGILGEPKDNSAYPAGAFTGVGTLGDMTVRCIAAPVVLLFRNGFEPRDVDRHDVAALCSHFDLKRPSRYLPQLSNS